MRGVQESGAECSRGKTRRQVGVRFRFTDLGSGFRVLGLQIRVEGEGSRAQGSELRVWGLGFRV
jgi:hypothetical protein